MPWTKIVNAIGYQIVWFTSIYGASISNIWLGFLASLLFAIAMLSLGGKSKNDFRLLCIGLCVGMSVDSFFAASGLIQYDAAWPFNNTAPLWILALWLSFSLTLNHSMSFLRGNLWIASLFGLIGGPIAYLGADRIFDVLHYGADILWVVLALGIAWAIAIPAILFIDERLANLQKTIPTHSPN
jgi:Protein of unknown function (DUF2878)